MHPAKRNEDTAEICKEYSCNGSSFQGYKYRTSTPDAFHVRKCAHSSIMQASPTKCLSDTWPPMEFLLTCSLYRFEGEKRKFYRFHRVFLKLYGFRIYNMSNRIWPILGFLCTFLLDLSNKSGKSSTDRRRQHNFQMEITYRCNTRGDLLEVVGTVRRDGSHRLTICRARSVRTKYNPPKVDSSAYVDSKRITADSALLPNRDNSGE